MISEDHRERTAVDTHDGPGAPDPVLAALREMVGALDELVRTADDMTDRAETLAALRRAGRSWDDLLFTDEARRLTALLAGSAEAAWATRAISAKRARAIQGRDLMIVFLLWLVRIGALTP